MPEPDDRFVRGGVRGAFGRLFNVIAVWGIVALYLTFYIVYWKFGWTPWFEGVITVVGFCIIDLLEKNVIEEGATTGQYRIPHINISLHPRIRLFFILFLLMLMGALGGEALAALIAGVPSVLAGATYAPVVGSSVAVMFVYLDYWVSYTRKEGMHSSSQTGQATPP